MSPLTLIPTVVFSKPHRADSSPARFGANHNNSPLQRLKSALTDKGDSFDAELGPEKIATLQGELFDRRYPGFETPFTAETLLRTIEELHSDALGWKRRIPRRFQPLPECLVKDLLGESELNLFGPGLKFLVEPLRDLQQAGLIEVEYLTLTVPAKTYEGFRRGQDFPEPLFSRKESIFAAMTAPPTPPGSLAFPRQVKLTADGANLIRVMSPE